MLEKSEIAIPCECGQKTKKTVAWLKSNKSFTCACGIRVDVDASHFNREMQKAEKALDEFKRSLKTFGR